MIEGIKKRKIKSNEEKEAETKNGRKRKK